MGPLEAAVQLFPNSGIPIVSFTVFVSTDNGGAQGNHIFMRIKTH